MANRTRPAVALALVFVGLGGLVASAAAPDDRTPEPVERVHRYYKVGPSADYESDNGAIGTTAPLRWQAPAEGEKAAVVEVSFEYRTKGRGPFSIGVSVGDPDADPGDDGTGGEVTVRPQQFQLAPAPRPTATAVRFLAPTLEAGQRYEALVGVNSVFPPGRSSNIIRTRKVLLTIDFTDR